MDDPAKTALADTNAILSRSQYRQATCMRATSVFSCRISSHRPGYLGPGITRASAATYQSALSRVERSYMKRAYLYTEATRASVDLFIAVDDAYAYTALCEAQGRGQT